MPSRVLRKVQLGKEVTWGTAVVATAKLAGLSDCTLQVADTVEAIEDVGTVSPTIQVANVEQHGEGSIEVAGTYEDILYFLHGLFGVVTPSGSGPYTWTYNGPHDSLAAPQAFTIEYGTTNASYKMAGGVITTCTISGEAGGFWKIESDWIGKSIAAATLASLTDRTVEVVRMADTKLYVDIWSGTPGTTELPATLVSFELEINPNRSVGVFAGEAVPGRYTEDRWEGTLTLKLEFTSAVKAYIDALIGPALVQKIIEIEATSGTKSIKLDFAGTLIDGAELFDDNEGNMAVELKFQGTYNTTFANWVKAVVANSVATLP